MPLQYHSLTYRQFINKLNGFRKAKEYESRERLIIMRNMMYAALAPHSKQIKKPEDIMHFDFEKKVVSPMSEAEYQKLMDEIEMVKKFYAEQDMNKLN